MDILYKLEAGGSCMEIDDNMISIRFPLVKNVDINDDNNIKYIYVIMKRELLNILNPDNKYRAKEIMERKLLTNYFDIDKDIVEINELIYIKNIEKIKNRLIIFFNSKDDNGEGLLSDNLLKSLDYKYPDNKIIEEAEVVNIKIKTEW